VTRSARRGFELGTGVGFGVSVGLGVGNTTADETTSFPSGPTPTCVKTSAVEHLKPWAQVQVTQRRTEQALSGAPGAKPGGKTHLHVLVVAHEPGVVGAPAVGVKPAAVASRTTRAAATMAAAERGWG